MEKAIRSARKLKEGLAHHDYFGPIGDDSQIYTSRRGEILYEFACEEGALQLGDLRNLLSFFEEQGYI